jgi:hypothetical protein
MQDTSTRRALEVAECFANGFASDSELDHVRAYANGAGEPDAWKAAWCAAQWNAFGSSHGATRAVQKKELIRICAQCETNRKLMKVSAYVFCMVLVTCMVISTLLYH